METSAALDSLPCGFLGLLHYGDHPGAPGTEFDLDLITTAPSVVYRIYGTDDR